MRVFLTTSTHMLRDNCKEMLDGRNMELYGDSPFSLPVIPLGEKADPLLVCERIATSRRLHVMQKPFTGPSRRRCYYIMKGHKRYAYKPVGCDSTGFAKEGAYESDTEARCSENMYCRCCTVPFQVCRLEAKPYRCPWNTRTSG